jgi:hypothetical protein
VKVILAPNGRHEFWGVPMGKSQDAKKETKKAPAKTAKEKKAAKDAKKSSKD